MNPVEIDVAVGASGGRVCFHIEIMATVDPYVFVHDLQAHVLGMLEGHVATPAEASAQVLNLPEKPDEKPKRRTASR